MATTVDNIQAIGWYGTPDTIAQFVRICNVLVGSRGHPEKSLRGFTITPPRDSPGPRQPAAAVRPASPQPRPRKPATRRRPPPSPLALREPLESKGEPRRLEGHHGRRGQTFAADPRVYEPGRRKGVNHEDSKDTNRGGLHHVDRFRPEVSGLPGCGVDGLAREIEICTPRAGPARCGVPSARGTRL